MGDRSFYCYRQGKNQSVRGFALKLRTRYIRLMEHQENNNFSDNPNTSLELRWRFAVGLRQPTLKQYAKSCIKRGISFFQLVAKIENAEKELV